MKNGVLGLLLLCGLFLTACAAVPPPVQEPAVQPPTEMPAPAQMPTVQPSPAQEDTAGATGQDDSEERELIAQLPDYWLNWVPDDESAYIVGAKPEGPYTYQINWPISDVKAYCQDLMADTDWEGGEWKEEGTMMTYTLSKHNPRYKLQITISGLEEQCHVSIYQEYRESDGY